MIRFKTRFANVKKLLKVHHCKIFFLEKTKNVRWHFCVRLTIGSLLRRLHVSQALRMLNVHQVNEQLERAATLVASNFKENYIFHVAWFDSGTAKLVG